MAAAIQIQEEEQAGKVVAQLAGVGLLGILSSMRTEGSATAISEMLTTGMLQAIFKDNPPALSGPQLEQFNTLIGGAQQSAEEPRASPEEYRSLSDKLRPHFTTIFKAALLMGLGSFIKTLNPITSRKAFLEWTNMALQLEPLAVGIGTPFPPDIRELNLAAQGRASWFMWLWRKDPRSTARLLLATGVLAAVKAIGGFVEVYSLLVRLVFLPALLLPTVYWCLVSPRDQGLRIAGAYLFCALINWAPQIVEAVKAKQDHKRFPLVVISDWFDLLGLLAPREADEEVLGNVMDRIIRMRQAGEPRWRCYVRAAVGSLRFISAVVQDLLGRVKP